MKIIAKNDYDTTIKINDRDVRCYSKKKIKELSPDGNYKIIGETFEKNKKRKEDIIKLANKELVVSKYGENSKVIYKRKGYFEVEENEYIVYIKSRLAFLLILFFILLAIVIFIYTGIKIYTSIPSVVPDYPLPPEDEQSTVIEDDNTKKTTSKDGGGSVRVRLSNIAKVDLNTGNIEMAYQNPSQSNQDSVITLVLISEDNEYIIARSGLIKSGKQITNLKLINNVVKLSEGVYRGKYIIDHYNPTTGEKALTNSNFSNVEIQVK
ncbi:MAG: hypothetical protein IKD77_01035 [Bacilli bacterium]|nr:hypothetical protein [Bacilli bacterium]